MEYYSALKSSEILTPATAWLNHEDVMFSEISQTQKTNLVGFHFCEVPRGVKFIETESRRVGARGWEGRGSQCLMGGRVSV